MRKYYIAEYTAVRDLNKGGHPIPKGSTTRFVVSCMTEEERAAYPEGTDIDVWAAAVFPVNATMDAETAGANAKLMCNYLNKVAEAQEKARLGAEIGFLN
jgi:hypothetical protein